MKVRRFVALDGSIRFVVPNWRRKLANESEQQFTDRVFAEAVEKDPSLVGLAFADIDDSTLPPRSRVDAQGDEHSVRDAWRMNGGGIVIVDESKVPPNWDKLTVRLNNLLPPAKRAALASELSALREAARTRDDQLVQAIYDRIKAAQGGGNPPLTVAQFTALQATLSEKKIPITL